jgi:glycosidase
MPGKNLSRDPSRTPMQWNGEEGAGFTTGKTWLRVSSSAKKGKRGSAEKEILVRIFHYTAG